MLPDPVPRDGERALARWGLLGEGAGPVSAAGARYPLAGLLLALPALEGTGLLDAARGTGGLKDGFYGLGATLLTLVFLALAGEPRAEGATRIPPAALGRVLGLDRAPEVKTIRRNSSKEQCDHASNDAVNCPARSRTRKPQVRGAFTQIHQQVADLLSCPRPVRIRGHAEEVHVTAADLHDEQAVQPLQRHCAVHVEEISGEHRRCLGAQNSRHVASVCRLGAGEIFRALRTRRTVDAPTR